MQNTGNYNAPEQTDEASIPLANLDLDKQQQRQKLLALSPEEAQARVNAVLRPDLWTVEPFVWEETLPPCNENP